MYVRPSVGNSDFYIGLGGIQFISLFLNSDWSNVFDVNIGSLILIGSMFYVDTDLISVSLIALMF